VAAQLVLTSCEHALDLRLKVDCPVAWLSPPDDARAAIQLPGGRGGLVVHPQHRDDAAAIEEMLKRLNGLDLAEPFARVREAVAEARKLGVSQRAA
jgi:hypothetical protein